MQLEQTLSQIPYELPLSEIKLPGSVENFEKKFPNYENNINNIGFEKKLPGYETNLTERICPTYSWRKH
jgi:hypothetical protein|tara:strand:- start:98 stop:304 length:207 start_codon:yes stop_codon:yes gene_type:complete